MLITAEKSPDARARGPAADRSGAASTWGVLDRLLEEERLQIVAISGTSAGAMNAALLADGWTEGSAAGAHAALRTYWQEVSRAPPLSVRCNAPRSTA